MKLNLPFVAGILLAAISLFFSATGLVHLFAGAGIAIMVMAGAFELAKVTITVHLIRNFRWRVVPLALLGALLCLTVISSLGVYGYLGRAYNVGHAKAIVGAGSVTALEQQVKALEADRDRLYAQIEAIPASQGTNRRRLTSTLQPELESLDATIRTRRDSLTALQSAQVGRANDVGELGMAAVLFGVSQEDLARAVITVLAFLLDPLAILLVSVSGVKSEANLSGDRQQRLDPHQHTSECTPSNCDISGAEFEVMADRGAVATRDRVAALQDAVKSTESNGLSPGLNAALRKAGRRGAKVVANEKHRA